MFGGIAKLLVVFIVSCYILSKAQTVSKNLQNYLDIAVEEASRGDFSAARSTLEAARATNSLNVDVLQLLGVVNYKLGNIDIALHLLDEASSLDNYRNLGIVANYIEILRSSGNLQKASSVGRTALDALDSPRLKDSSLIQYNLAVVEMNLGHRDRALELLEKALEYNPSLLRAWHDYSDILLKVNPEQAEQALRLAVSHHPNDYTLRFMLGTACQMQNKLTEALENYLYTEQLNGSSASLKGNIAATLQSLGRTEEALTYYKLALQRSSDDAGLYNNYGALLGIMGKHDEEVRWLTEALRLQPNLGPALVNLAGHYQDEGDLAQARELLRRAASPETMYSTATRTPPILFKIRDALMLSAVAQSWAQMVEERAHIVKSLRAILADGDNSSSSSSSSNSSSALQKVNVDTSLDRIHFYVSYHGLNDREIQDLVAKVYLRHLNLEYQSPYLNPTLSFPEWVQDAPNVNNAAVPAAALLMIRSTTPQSSATVPRRRARVGFISKFLGVFEPHGMLLDGVMQHLPRDRFEVIALPIARGDGKPLAPTVQAACDAVHVVSLNYEHAQAMLQELRLDILVFADTVSEPMNHFLAHSRLAPIQMAFWGNPITSGSPQIDYFVSADIMEHPFRTRMSVAHEPYAEQVVLLEGQGIWYLRPDIEADLVNSNLKHRVAPAREFSRADFGLQEAWFLYVLPQSTFKIHPLYDLVLRDILHRAPPHAHLVVTGGRRPRWTQIYLTRLQEALGPELSQRLHMVERVSSEQFPALLRIADVILHPFPFDGSKTSADALEAHKPLVTLPAEYLRGRMALAFLRTMGLPELVARTRAEYVDISVRLATDKGFYNRMVGSIADRVDLIWEDMEVPYTWTNLLSGLTGAAPMSWQAFLAQTGKNVTEEQSRTARRNAYAQQFDSRWGPGSLLLQNGVASLESMVASAEQYPCIFYDWNCGGGGDDALVHAENDSGLASVGRVAMDGAKAGANVEEWEGIRSQYLKHASAGRFEAALPLALSLYPTLSADPLYLTELGLVHVYTGNHSAGYDYCSRAAAVVPSSSTALGCVGLSAMYLPLPPQETVSTLRNAIVLKQAELALMASTAARLGEVAPTDSYLLEQAAGVFASSAFEVSLTALQFNLLTTLGMHGQHRECLEWFAELHNLPAINAGTAHIVTFATVRWSDEARVAIDAVEARLRASGTYQPRTLQSTLWDEIRRVQATAMETLPSALKCRNELHNSAEYSDTNYAALNDFMTVLRERERANQPAPSLLSGGSDPHSGAVINGVVLLLQHFVPKESVHAQEINVALWRNLQNEHISDIYLLNEVNVSFAGFPNAHKIHQVVIGERLTFKRALAFANEHLTGRTVIIANSDIFFDDTLVRLSGRTAEHPVPRLQDTRTVLALLKWRYHADSLGMTLNLRTDSQDAWVFQPPLSPAALDELDFYMGLPRCDNRLVHVLTHHNYTLLDPAFAIHALELDTVQRAAPIYNTKQTVVGPGAPLLLSDAFRF